MLKMCRTIFRLGKDVVLYSVFFVAKFITELEAKGVYAADLINKRHYWPKEVLGEFIGNNF